MADQKDGDVNEDVKRMQEIVYEVEEQKAEYESLMQQVSALEATAEDHEEAVKALESLEDVREGKEILVPVGAGSYVYATVARSDAVLMGVGSGVSVERNVTDAKKALDERKDEVEEAVETLREQADKIKSRLNDLQQEYQQIQKSLRGPQGPGQGRGPGPMGPQRG